MQTSPSQQATQPIAAQQPSPLLVPIAVLQVGPPAAPLAPLVTQQQSPPLLPLAPQNANKPAAPLAPQSATQPTTSQIFHGMTFCAVGNLTVHHDEMERIIVAHGGEYKKSLTGVVRYLVTSEKLYNQKTLKTIEKAKDMDCHIIKEEFVFDCEKHGKLFPLDSYVLHYPKTEELKRKRSEENAKLEEQAAGAPEAKKREIEQQGTPTQLPGAPEEALQPSEAPKVAEEGQKEEEEKEETIPPEEIVRAALEGPILTEGNDTYYAKLEKIDLPNSNNFYEMKLVCPLTGGYILETRWGRYDATRQTIRNEKFVDKQTATDMFKKRFYNKTKNEWDSRYIMIKMPRCFTMAPDQKLEEKKTGEGVPLPEPAPTALPASEKLEEIVREEKKEEYHEMEDKARTEEAQISEELKQAEEITKSPEKAELIADTAQPVEAISKTMVEAVDLTPKVETGV